jgi:hypothetical protein
VPATIQELTEFALALAVTKDKIVQRDLVGVEQTSMNRADQARFVEGRGCSADGRVQQAQNRISVPRGFD